MKHLPIGILDSGLGGLTAMRAITRLLPREKILYFADTKNLPYGEKTPDQLLHYTLENASFLCSQGIKLLLLACHTVSCHTLTALTKHLSIPVVGMIEPSLEAIKSQEPTSIAVLGTTNTIQSGIYQTQLQQLFPHVPLFSIACPLFVPLIEQNLPLDSVVRQTLAPILDRKISTVLLACTHYPLISPLLQQILGPHVHIVDPSAACARLVRAALLRCDLQNLENSIPVHEFFEGTQISERLQKLEKKIALMKHFRFPAPRGLK